MKNQQIQSLALLGLLVSLFIIGCSDKLTEPSLGQSFVGTWVQRAFENETTIMERTSGLDSSKYGFVFYHGGKFFERKNAGWCGTPPITYANFAGVWEPESDSLLHIEVDYWDGRMEYKIRIILLTDSELRFELQHVRFQPRPDPQD